MLGAFADEHTIARLEADMTRTGVMAGADMAATFDMLRANDLIFSYVVSNWLMGQQPAGIRHSRLERRQHPAARGHALLLPAVAVCEEPARQG